MKNTHKVIMILTLLFIEAIVNTVFVITHPGNSFIIAIFSVLANSCIYIAYLFYINKPVVVLLAILLRSVIFIVKDTINGDELKGAIVDQSPVMILGSVMLCYYTFKAKLKSDKLVDRIKELLKFSDKPIECKLWHYIIMYGFLVTSFNVMYRSQELSVYSEEYGFRTLACAVVLIPLFELIAIASTSSIAYHFMIYNEALSIYSFATIYRLDNLKEITMTVIISFICRSVVLVIAIIEYAKLKFNKNTSKNK